MKPTSTTNMSYKSGVESESPESQFWRGWSLPFEGDSDSEYVLLDCTLSLVLRSFVAVSLTFAEFNLRLKFCVYTIVPLLLEKNRFSQLLKSSFSTQSVCHTLCPGVGVKVQVFRAKVGVPQKKGLCILDIYIYIYRSLILRPTYLLIYCLYIYNKL